MNNFLNSHKAEFKTFVENVCSIPAERSTTLIPPSYAAPIHILGRLPATSREGFPSLPYLIDHARNFAYLINLWRDSSSAAIRDPRMLEGDLLKFHHICQELYQRTRDCLNKAEQAERPSDNLETKWEELVENMGKKTFYDDSSSTQVTTPSVDPVAEPIASASATSSKRNSLNSFTFRRTSPAVQPRPGPSETAVEDPDEETPPSSASATWDDQRAIPYRRKHSETGEGASTSVNSSQLSFDPVEPRPPQSPKSRDGGKYKLGDFVGGFRRKAKEKEMRDKAGDRGDRIDREGGNWPEGYGNVI